MRSSRLRRILMVAVTALAVSSALLAVLFALALRGGVLTQDGSQAGWIMPVAVALLVLGVSWMLLGETPRRDLQRPTRPSETCPECDRDVTEGWRLCPWCGYRSDQPERCASPAETRGEGR